MNQLLEQVSRTILAETCGIKEVYEGVHALHKLFASLTGISAHDTSNNSEDIFLPSGKAISPAKAAHCLLEQKRTMVFLRGIHKAILQLQRRFPAERINILYAGCGPYATLLTPMTAVFSPGEVAFHLMDINKISLEAAGNLYKQLDLGDYVAAYIHADATTYCANEGTTFHMIVSETMLHALMKEPQVAIMRNLIPQMHEQGICIPSEITISAQLLQSLKEQESFMEGGQPAERIFLGNIFTINKELHSGQPAATISVPADISDNHILNLLTDIRVFEEEQLSIYDCSLTLPIRVKEVRPTAGKVITFEYTTGATPGFIHTIN